MGRPTDIQIGNDRAMQCEERSPHKAHRWYAGLVPDPYDCPGREPDWEKELCWRHCGSDGIHPGHRHWIPDAASGSRDFWCYGTEPARVGQHKVVCLCGSVGFREAFLKLYSMFSLEGRVVLMPALTEPLGRDITSEMKEQLRGLHRQKIDMADCVYIVNRHGYIGEDTSAEIEYATSIGKPVLYYERRH